MVLTASRKHSGFARFSKVMFAPGQPVQCFGFLPRTLGAVMESRIQQRARRMSSPRSAEQFEKIGSGPGYIWGFGVGHIDFVVPARADRRRVSQVIVRAHIQPVLPIDASPEQIKTRVTLLVN